MKELPPSTPPTEDMSDWSQPLEGDLNCPPPLTHSWRTWQGDGLAWSRRGDGSWQESTPKPSIDNSSEWVTWRANQVNTPTWWLELCTVPGERDAEEFAQKIWASFELHRRRSHVWHIANDYSAPPFPQNMTGSYLFLTSCMVGRITA